MSRVGLAALVTLLGLSGCMDNSLLSAGKDDSAFAPEDFQEGTLRLDITPPAGLATPELQPQTLLAMPPRYTELSAELRPTVTLFGLLQAEVAHPWGATGVPTEVVAFQGVVSAVIENSVENGKAGADETGTVTLPLVADNFYALTIVPDDASASPLVVFEGLDILADEDLTQTLPLGIPVYGRVSDAEGNPLGGVSVRIHRTDSTNSTPSATTRTDQTGWYTLRVADVGEYAVEVIGEETSDRDVVPSLSLPVSVPDDQGATLPIDVGVLGRARVAGSLGDSADDLDVEGAVIRAVSTSLTGSTGSLTIETTSVNGGDFTLDLLPGSYTVSVIPDYDPHPRSSPISVGVEVAAGDELDLGRMALPGLGTLAGVVVDVEGDPVAGAQVKATQTGYGHHAYNATTDQDGSYRLEIPVTPYEVTVTPVGKGGAVTRRNLTPGQNGNITLDVGQPVNGIVTWQGAPVGFALIEVRDLRSGALLGSTSSDTSGAFAFEVVVPTTSPEATDSGAAGTTPTEPADTGPGDTGDTAIR